MVTSLDIHAFYIVLQLEFLILFYSGGFNGGGWEQNLNRFQQSHQNIFSASTQDIFCVREKYFNQSDLACGIICPRFSCFFWKEEERWKRKRDLEGVSYNLSN